ncbi:DUF3014 domain-containing protein [Trichloromonas sp.]|uniref:DUF3014 domain-containing protein n=1 Tax=Trichloromonas sp. TaxID=3069249 RepID=UPI003D81389B
MKKYIIPAILLAVAIAIIFIAFPPDDVTEQQLPPGAVSTLPETAAPELPVKYPIAEPAQAVEPPPAAEQPESKPALPLPGLEMADTVMRELLTLLGGEKKFIELFQLDHFIQRFVVTVDNLPRKDIPRRQLPVKGASGPLLVQGEKGREVISPYNERRYAIYIELAEALDSGKLVDIYVRNYPLFQQAYSDLGYPSAYFNDRLVEVIDHLLETPELQEPIRLERPGVLYRFADPELEARSAGQKILLRIGNDNAAWLKAKLKQLREQLMTQVRRQS